MLYSPVVTGLSHVFFTTHANTSASKNARISIFSGVSILLSNKKKLLKNSCIFSWAMKKQELTLFYSPLFIFSGVRTAYVDPSGTRNDFPTAISSGIGTPFIVRPALPLHR